MRNVMHDFVWGELDFLFFLKTKNKKYFIIDFKNII